MSNGAEKLSMAELVSAVSDGEGDRQAVASVSAGWRDDAELRARWHGYQLIGDAMRSDELAGRGRDAEFLKRLRARLDGEPVVLSPARVVEVAPSTAHRARRWATPAAMAAGFMMVAGAVLVTRAPTGLPSAQLAQQSSSTAAAVASVAPTTAESLAAGKLASANVPAPTASEAAMLIQGGVLLRDARMQQYFAAHQQFGGSTALGLPSAFLRNATFETPAAAQAGQR